MRDLPLNLPGFGALNERLRIFYASCSDHPPARRHEFFGQ